MHRRRRLVKPKLYFTSEIRDSLRDDLFGTPMALLKLSMQRRHSILNEIRKISRRRPRSLDDAQLGHFTLLFGRGRQRNPQRFIAHMQSYCFAHETFVTFSFRSSSWFF